MRIFIVEDNEYNIKLFRAMLRNAKYEITVFENAEDLLIRLEDSQPDLILMDWGLPGISGIEATEIIRSRDIWAHIPVVIISAHAFGEERKIAERAGATSYVTKPIDFSQFLRTVDSFEHVATSV